MASQPSLFLQQLALQTQLLANLQWLCEFQVLACIPLDGSVAFEEVAGISNVPVDQLQRAARLMTTAGFLCEPTTGHIAHTPLSASFVTEPDLLDAALFLAQVAGPAALRMPRSLQHFAPYDRGQPWPALAQTDNRLSLLGENYDPNQPKVQRQFTAYLAHGILDETAAVDEVLKLLDWEGLGAATIVDVHPPSTTTVAALATLAPTAQFVVQTSAPSNGHSGLITNAEGGGSGATSWMTYHLPSSVSSRVTVQSRTAAAAQTVLSAAVYILRLPSPSPLLPWTSIRSQASLELQAHIQVLRNQPTSRLILTALVLPLPGTVDRGAEAMVRLRDMSLLQLSSERQPERLEIVELLTGVRDSAGGLVLNREVQGPSSAVVAFEVRYQASNGRGR
ncbi:hypothetical protein HK57_00561 [Aspergillus ustus]|uniref:Uncharacterized protein n=1 Tax=Aspergillus ustus TaxID=40382 RepID=A0A0C1EG60_ASPUT|nr:hypothetical protein HK57_00561 [Aspergillus ustus]